VKPMRSNIRSIHLLELLQLFLLVSQLVSTEEEL